MSDEAALERRRATESRRRCSAARGRFVRILRGKERGAMEQITSMGVAALVGEHWRRSLTRQ